jgi:hypothetical protein
MKTHSPSLAACFVVGASCLAWIGGISLAMVYFLGLSSTVGWIIAGSLGFSSIVAVTIILYEMRHAVEMPDGTDHADIEGPPVSIHWGPPMGATPVPRNASPAFRVSGDLY